VRHNKNPSKLVFTNQITTNNWSDAGRKNPASWSQIHDVPHFVMRSYFTIVAKACMHLYTSYSSMLAYLHCTVYKREIQSHKQSKPTTDADLSRSFTRKTDFLSSLTDHIKQIINVNEETKVSSS
jgi:hypothetical protein